jgi:hypothetical protein
MLDSLDTAIAFSVIMLVVSMLITIAVQMLSAALNLRGKNLAKGLTNTLNTILPGFEDQAEGFAKKILSGRLLSDSSAQKLTGRYASAARPDEVFDAMYRIATGRRNIPELRDSARRLLRGLGLNEAFLDDAEAQLAVATRTVQGVTGTVQGLKDTAAKAIEQLPESQRATVQQALAEVTTKLATYEAAAAQQAQQTAATVTQAVEAAYKKFQYWFEVGQERAQQWFTTHTRWFTIGFAVLFAFWLQLDTVDIFRLVSTNRAVRDGLVAQAGVVTKQAEKILVDSPSVLQQALDAWRTALTDDKAKKAVEGEVAALAETRGSLREKVRKKLEGAGIQGTDGLLAELNKTIDKTAQENLKDSAKQFGEVKLDLDQTGFALFQPDGKGRWGETWCDGFWDHFWGMTFSAALLSLGAPFWFNALKSLSSLRSKVSENISTEKKGDQTAPGTDPPKAKTAAPVTVAP